MEIRVLQYFIAVAQEKNFTKAAKYLHISQPSVSRQIQKLEDELGVKLFDRTENIITLTASGQYLYEQAKQIVDTTQRTEQNIKNQHLEIRGTIRIGTGESALLFLPVIKAIKAIAQKYPKIEFEIKSEDADQVMEKLENASIDLGVILGYTDSDYNFLSLPGKTSWGLIVNRRSEFNKYKQISVDQLAKQDIILPMQKQDSGYLKAWLEKCKPQMHVIAHYNLLNNALLMVKENIAPVLALDQVVDLDQELKFIPLKPKISANMNLIWSKKRPIPQALQLFIEEIKKQIT